MHRSNCINMAKTGKAYDLVIVESPAKAKTIGQFLGDGFEVRSSYGHIRDLKKNNFGVDVANNYAPEYIVPEEKMTVVAELKKLGREDIIVVVGGVIPAQDYEELYQDGAAAIFGPGTPIAKSSIKMLELLMEE